MSDTRDSGGPAFPHRLIGDKGHEWPQAGMSLRDYFAGQALTAMCGGDGWPQENDGPEMARRAYIFADAMLAARKA